MMIKIKVAVFDFDGVIVDSNAVKSEAWKEVFFDRSDKDRDILFQAVDKKIGDRYKILEFVLRNIGEPDAKIGELVNFYALKFENLIQKAILQRGLFFGNREGLEILSKQYPLYVNSSTPEASVIKTCELLNILKYFKGIYGHPATKIDNFKKITEIEKVKPEEILMVGDDLEKDWKPAREFGVKFVGFSNAENNWIKKKMEWPVVASLSEILF